MNENYLNLIKKEYDFNNPDEVVEIFEKKVAKFAGARYGIAVDSCTNGIFLCLKYINKPTVVEIPLHTYLSVPMAILNSGYNLKITERHWNGFYELKPLKIFDAAGIWMKGMMAGEFTILSFQHKKVLSLGRGGMILTDNEDAYQWLRRARHDGRTPGISHFDDDVKLIGYHMYMTPEKAAEGLVKFNKLEDMEKITHSFHNYKPLTNYTIFSEYE